MTTPLFPFVSDEDIAIRAPTDFVMLCPRDQVIAAGSDGSFTTLDPWTLRSSAVDFASIGLAPGHVVQLQSSGAASAATPRLFAVEQVTAQGVHLRRIGLASGNGQPPGVEMDVPTVAFRVATYGPQIESVGFDLMQRFGLDPGTEGRAPADLVDPRELREATVVSVLERRCFDLAQEPDSPLARKARHYGNEFDSILSRIALHWRGASRGIAPPASARFGTRLSR